MNKKYTFAALFLMILISLTALSLAAQETPETTEEDTAPPTNIYVTTQDFSSFRKGPGQDFERISVVDPEVTLPAYGRTADTRWIQVQYNGQLGWIAAFLLIWSGDVITLPVDGVNPNPFVRRANAVGITTRETPIYRDEVDPSTQVGTLPKGTRVELTGRLGERGFFRFQIMHQGQLYWVGSWDIRVIDGDYRRLLDIAYLYPYGRLLRQLEENVAVAIGSYTTVNDIWLRLDRGDRVLCSPIPTYVPLIITPGDARRESNFVAAVNALGSATTAINSAISAFEDLCSNAEAYITPADIDSALADLAEARRNLILVGSLVEPIRYRNPLLSTFEGS